MNNINSIIVDDDSDNVDITNNSLGQFFTTNLDLQNKVYEFILNQAQPTTILEPSIGQGHLVERVLNSNPLIIFDMYEIDSSIELLDIICQNDVIFCDFLLATIAKKYKTIIGNPPFVKTKTGNLYIDFIKKCCDLLDDGGELIFIVPSDFFKLTSASNLLNNMMSNGTFTHIYHPNLENLFENAKIDVMIFRYCKDVNLVKKVLYNDRLLHIINSNGLITFSENENLNTNLFEDYFNIYVGMVSGKEEVFKNTEFGNIDVLNGLGVVDRYIYYEELPPNNDELRLYLFTNKDVLIGRKIKKFNENNWFEWGAARNLKAIRENMGRECIYIYNLTRHPNVAFKGMVQYFGGNLLMLVPKRDCNLDRIIEYLNSPSFKQNFLFANRFKIGHRQLSKSFIESSYL